MRSPLHRCLSALLVLLWATPVVASSSAALHVVLHHGVHADGEAEEIARLLRAAAHGHHHDLEAPEHEHAISLSAFAPLPAPGATAAVASSISTRPARDPALGRDACSRHGPPGPLFTFHCSLLL